MNKPNQTTDLVPLDPQQRAVELKSLTAVSGKLGDNAIERLAEAEGDGAAIAVVSRLNPIEVARLMRAGDTSVPTMTAFLANPEQVAQMLSMDPLAWEKELQEASVEQLQNMALDLLCQILVHADTERQKQILDAIGDDENAFFYLCFPFIGYGITIERLGANLDPVLKVAEIESDHLDTSDLGAHDNEGDEEPEESRDDLLEYEQESRVHNIDLTYLQMLKDVFAIIHEATPDLASRLADFITHQDESSWENILQLIESMGVKAERQLGENADDGEFQNMFEVDKKK